MEHETFGLWSAKVDPVLAVFSPKAKHRLFHSINYTPRVSHFDPASEYSNFRGFFVLFWIGLSIMVVTTALRNIKETGSSSTNKPQLFTPEPDQPSRFVQSIVASPPSARRPQMINTNNPLNKAEAHPSAFISIDTIEPHPPGKIGIRMADLADAHSRSLTSTTSGRPHTYRTRGVAAARRKTNPKGAARAGKVVDEASKTRNRLKSRLDGQVGTLLLWRLKIRLKRERWQRKQERKEDRKKAATETKQISPAVCTNMATETSEQTSDSSILKKRDRGRKVPGSLDEACEADRMLWEWRLAGKTWAEITPRWIELTGKSPGKSSLGVRFMKLQTNFAQAGGADDLMLLRYKAEAEAELETEVWAKVAAKIKAEHNIDMSIQHIRKRFRDLRRSGFKVGTTLDTNGTDDEAGCGGGGSARPVAARRSFSTSRKQLADHVRIVEVGPRDGLQNEKVSIPLSSKLELIRRLSQTGVTHLEAGSFVPAKWVPQMASTAEILQTLTAQPPPAPHGIAYNYLVPNIRGLQDLISLFAAATESFSRKNINCSIAESLERFRPVLELAKEHNIRVRGYVSVALGCPYEGPDVDPHRVAELTATLLEMGCDEVSVADTTGMGTAPKTRRLLQTLKEAGILNDDLALHFHDTYGQALVNTVVALEHGVRTFDSSVGGLGGCPYSKGATGNVATEDLLHLLHSLGLETGIDIVQMAEIGQWISRELGKANESRAGKATLARLSHHEPPEHRYLIVTPHPHPDHPSLSLDRTANFLIGKTRDFPSLQTLPWAILHHSQPSISFAPKVDKERPADHILGPSYTTYTAQQDINSAVSSLASVIESVATSLASGGESVATSLATGARSVASDVTSDGAGAVSTLTSGGESVITSLITVITSGAKSVASDVTSGAAGVVSTVTVGQRGWRFGFEQHHR
ncbi:hypothetical protein DV735_g5352, partial [Chaetothyriales sp. CBS 134920]